MAIPHTEYNLPAMPDTSRNEGNTCTYLTETDASYQSYSSA